MKLLIHHGVSMGFQMARSIVQAGDLLGSAIAEVAQQGVDAQQGASM